MIYQADLWDEPIEVVDNRPVLMDVQRDLLERGRLSYQKHRRVLWQASCGAGKTVIASEQTCRAVAMGKSVLHIVHRRRLVDQMIGTLKRFGVEASPVMEGRKRWNARVNCASRDTLLAMIEGGGDLPRAELILWDEAHVQSKKVQEWYLRNCPGSYWTGYTATPVSADGCSLNPPYQDLVCMAPTSELLRIGRLCPVKVYDPKAVGCARKRGDKVKPVGDPVTHWKKYAEGKPTVVFASKVSESKRVVGRYLEEGIAAEHIDASTPEEEREAVFERSRTGKTLVISNVGVLIEGVDLPWLVCCQILRGCNSLILWIQATGRVMRSFPGKTHGIILDHSGAVYDFGPPDSDFTWTLDDEGVNSRANKPPKDRQPVACIACGFVFVAKPACPQCGRVLAKKQRKSLMDTLKSGDGVLTEFAGGQATAVSNDTLTRLWKRCCHIGKAKGWHMGRVATVFGQTAKMPPWEAGMDVPLPCGKEGWQMSAADWLLSQKG